ncbi:MAG: Stk1 family PASTA domain-containing Ser/Thr kinase [Actinomycetales bacterium]|nr:Stk1 family PASTA domain-containing Ser/Thr kinase [Actinomycetales bacterium]
MTDGVTTGTHLLADRYQIGEQLGRGGMAEVHAGYDTRLGRQVAVKLLRPALATDPAFRTRFRQEAQAAARMTHPTVVRVYDAGEQTVRDPAGHDVQLPFIVMERIDGTLLKDLIAKGPMDPAEAVRITDGILTALEYSHRAGVVHRDIKPGNVMVTPAGQVKVMDFGIARAISDSSASIAQTSAILGTAEYFSPEQARGESVDTRTDLYSTGVVLYELLTGRPPFRAESPVAVAYQHLSEDPVPPASVNPKVSPALNAVVLRALAKDRFERFQSASEFREALAAALDGKVPDGPVGGGDEFATTLFGVNPASTAASAATLRRLSEQSADRAPRTQTRPPVAWIWGGIALVILLVAAAMFWVFSLRPTDLVGPGAAVAVPDVVGMSYDSSGTGPSGSQTLLDAGLQVRKVEQVITPEGDEQVPAKGTILSTDPPAGETVSPGTTVVVTVSAGPQLITVPNLAFRSAGDATAAIEGLGLTVAGSVESYSPDVSAGTVMGIQLPDSSTVVTDSVEVPAGTALTIVVSNGKVDIPSVVGKPAAEARDLLGGTYHLTVKLSPDHTGCSVGNITSQSLSGVQPQGSTVTLLYC